MASRPSGAARLVPGRLVSSLPGRAPTVAPIAALPAWAAVRPPSAFSALGLRRPFAAAASDGTEGGDGSAAAADGSPADGAEGSASAMEAADADRGETESAEEGAGEKTEEEAAGTPGTPDVEAAEEKEHEIAFEASLPASWRDASEWVDLEFERAGLGEESGVVLDSPWGSEEYPQPDNSVLWPHRAISEHRSRPFASNTGRTATGEEEETQPPPQLKENRERLSQLWRLSSSHGISWDELDRTYVTFAAAGKQRYDEWSRKKQDDGVPQAVLEKKKATKQAVQYLKRFVKNPEELYPSRTKRLASRIYARKKKEWLSPWRPGRLTTHLQQLVAARMLRRETEERAFGLQRPPGV